MKRAGGFTLVELLVIIAIIGFLSTIILVNLRAARVKARDIQRTAAARNILSALIDIHTTDGSFPCTSLQASFQTPGTFMQFLVDRGYLKTNPKDPINASWATTYEFRTFKKTTGGACGQIAYFGIYSEGAPIVCPPEPFARAVGTQHCHMFYPEPLPCPSNPYNLPPDEPGLPADCPPGIAD